MGIACTFQPLKEGYRSWASGFCVSKAVSGPKLEWAYEFVNWFLSGWAGAYLNRQGYYSAVLSTAKANMTADEWGYWMEGKAAVADIKAPDGTTLERRDGRERLHGPQVERIHRRLKSSQILPRPQGAARFNSRSFLPRSTLP
jgi:putative spermidine/putrescine transport system substrate-binding protein